MFSTTNVILLKTLVVLLVFCFAECAAGSCMNYGHSCWGGHGKRGGEGMIPRGVRDDGPVGDTRWYLSRLIQPSGDIDMKSWRTGRIDGHKKPNGLNRHLQNDSDVEPDTKRFDEKDGIDGETNYEDPESEEVVLMEEPERPIGQKMRLYKLMKKMQKN